MEIKQAAWPDILRIYREKMPQHFPANELKPEACMRRMYEDGCYEGFLCREPEGEAGYAFFFCLPGEPAVLLDFRALEEAFRGRKIGSSFLDELRAGAYAGRDILLEIDDPDKAPDEEKRTLWLRRQEFYRRLGAVDTGLRSCIWEAPYRILCLPAVKGQRPGREETREKLSRFYREMYGEEVYQRDIVIE